MIMPNPNPPQTITLRDLAGTLYALAEKREGKAARLRSMDLGELALVETERAGILFGAATELLLMEDWADE